MPWRSRSTTRLLWLAEWGNPPHSQFSLCDVLEAMAKAGRWERDLEDAASVLCWVGQWWRIWVSIDKEKVIIPRCLWENERQGGNLHGDQDREIWEQNQMGRIALKRWVLFNSPLKTRHRLSESDSTSVHASSGVSMCSQPASSALQTRCLWWEQCLP